MRREFDECLVECPSTSAQSVGIFIHHVFQNILRGHAAIHFVDNREKLKITNNDQFRIS